MSLPPSIHPPRLVFFPALIHNRARSIKPSACLPCARLYKSGSLRGSNAKTTGDEAGVRGSREIIPRCGASVIMHASAHARPVVTSPATKPRRDEEIAATTVIARYLSRSDTRNLPRTILVRICSAAAAVRKMIHYDVCNV